MSPNRTVLGFDTSGEYCAVALSRDGRVEASILEPMKRGQAERLFGLIFDAMAHARLDFDDLDAVGVGVGPGSFTGTRVSAAAARGISMSTKVPAIGVSRFDSLTYGAKGGVLASVRLRNGNFLLRPGAGSAAMHVNWNDMSEFGGFDGVVIGDDAEEISKKLSIRHASPAFSIAEAVALDAASRDSASVQRPAPLYARPPSASYSVAECIAPR